MSARVSIIISCSKREASTIRRLAALQHRTMSGYMLHALLRTIDQEDMVLARLGRLPPLRSRRDSGPRTTVLLWCSRKEAQRIRAAAKRRDGTTSGFVLHVLRNSWKARIEMLSKQNAEDCPSIAA